MTKHFPGVKTFVRAHDLAHGLNLEKAGATAVVPETLEPSLQLAAAALSNLEYQNDEVNTIINEFRRKNTSQLQELASIHNTSIGFTARMMASPPPPGVATQSPPAAGSMPSIAGAAA
uniref:Uncharacterized protein n=1 Tax=Chlamydomonas euryale TaxID=1486919 RepID=A0A7R9V216_9CHLO|mmetsp:Transcript_14733/g.43228  ORF Transcript_14733/g.43228 Transcript_14733/m.43228 type:complete len:118 (+) Transcript_14733:318-671(+)